jgi:hypothetical protein
MLLAPIAGRRLFGMTRLVVNNETRSVDATLKTWGELLASVDQGCAVQGQLVTAARIDGVDEPSFRDPEYAGRPLADLAVVEVEVSTPADLVTESLREALDGLNSLRQFTVVTSQRFRGEDIPFANQGMAELTIGLRTLVGLMEALSAAIGVRLEALEWKGVPLASLLDEIGKPLEDLAGAQASEDWVTVADILEFDLEPALAQCEPFFHALADLASRAASRTHRPN